MYGGQVDEQPEKEPEPVEVEAVDITAKGKGWECPACHYKHTDFSRNAVGTINSGGAMIGECKCGQRLKVVAKAKPMIHLVGHGERIARV